MRSAIGPILGSLISAALLGGCVVPRSRNVAKAGGVTAERPKLDFILPRITTRQQWERDLGKFQTGVCDARFCWVRWTEPMSNFETISGYGSSRAWRIVNVLAEFDGDRFAATPGVCSERELPDCLNHFVMRVPPPLLAEAPLDCRTSGRETATLRPAGFKGIVRFGEDGAALQGHVAGLLGHPAPLTANPGWDRIDRVRVRYGSSPEELYITVHFRPPLQRVNFVEILLPPRDVWRLVGALAANNPRLR